MSNKTQPTANSIAEFISSIEDERRRDECRQLIDLMRRESGEEPVVWGPAIIGFGQYHYRYESGREGDFMRVGFSPRKQNLSIYIIPGFEPYQRLLQRLGKHKLGKSCLYIKRLEDVDLSVLTELIRDSLNDMKQRYPENA